MPKLRPLTKAQLEVIDIIAQLALAGQIEKSSEEMKGFQQHVTDSLTPKMKQVYAAINKRAQELQREFLEHHKRANDAS